MSYTAIEALQQARQRMRNCWGAIQSDQVIDKDVEGSLKRGMDEIDAALSAEAPDECDQGDNGECSRAECRANNYCCVGNVKVKDLEWIDKSLPIMPYYAECDDDGEWRYSIAVRSGTYFLKRYGIDCGEYPTLEAAKAAAQADYETRIRSALSTTLQETVGWVSHASAWRNALVIAKEHAEVAPPDIDDKAYWQHEINALDTLARQPVTAGWENTLADAVRKLGLEELVHGWHASGAYDKHPDELGVTLPTNCGTVYAIVAALKSEGRK